MGILLVFLGVVVAAIGWAMLLMGIGVVEADAAATNGLPYLSEAVEMGSDPSIANNIILLGYTFAIMGVIVWGFSRLHRLLDTLASAPEPVEETAPTVAPVAEPVATPQPDMRTEPAHEPAHEPRATNGESEPQTEPQTERRAQIVRDGFVEGRRLIEYENGMADVETSQGWRRFKSVDEAVAFLRG